MDLPHPETQLIRRLREQVHKSFLQVGEMEKLFELEIQHTRQEVEDREKLIAQKQQQIRIKSIEIQNNLKKKNSQFTMSIENLQLSLEQIQFKKEDSVRDDSISGIRNLLLDAKNNSGNEIQKLRELQNNIVSNFPNSPQVQELVQVSKNIYFSNCRLKQQLFISQQANDVYRNKITELEEMISTLTSQRTDLNLQNREVKEHLLREQKIFEEQIGILKGQILIKNKTVEHFKRQMTKYEHKSTPQIDISKLNKYCIAKGTPLYHANPEKMASKLGILNSERAHKSYKQNQKFSSDPQYSQKTSKFLTHRPSITRFQYQ